jgi:putative SOS response-associated peptidase YedK
VCGRFSLYEPAGDLAERFGIDEVLTEELPPRWNVAPTQPVYAVASTRDGGTRRLRSVRWGLVPSWAKDPTIGNRFINARAETVASARPYRAAFERRRCLIPAYPVVKIDRLGRRQEAQQPLLRTV